MFDDKTMVKPRWSSCIFIKRFLQILYTQTCVQRLPLGPEKVVVWQRSLIKVRLRLVVVDRWSLRQLFYVFTISTKSSSQGTRKTNYHNLQQFIWTYTYSRHYKTTKFDSFDFWIFTRTKSLNCSSDAMRTRCGKTERSSDGDSETSWTGTPWLLRTWKKQITEFIHYSYLIASSSLYFIGKLGYKRKHFDHQLVTKDPTA